MPSTRRLPAAGVGPALPPLSRQRPASLLTFCTRTQSRKKHAHTHSPRPAQAQLRRGGGGGGGGAVARRYRVAPPAVPWDAPPLQQGREGRGAGRPPPPGQTQPVRAPAALRAQKQLLAVLAANRGTRRPICKPRSTRCSAPHSIRVRRRPAAHAGRDATGTAATARGAAAGAGRPEGRAAATSTGACASKRLAHGRCRGGGQRRM